MPAFLRSLDDRVLGSKRRDAGADHDSHDDHDRDGDGRADRTSSRERGASTNSDRPARKHDGLPTFLSIFYRISRLVLLLLALVLVLAVVLVLAPANDMNGIVKNVLSLAERVAGPFKDVFTVMDPDRMKIVNYGVAAGVYALLATLVSKLPTGARKSAT
jgi:hypothetical protein